MEGKAGAESRSASCYQPQCRDALCRPLRVKDQQMLFGSPLSVVESPRTLLGGGIVFTAEAAHELSAAVTEVHVHLVKHNPFSGASL